jgi:hypothetical protein
MKRIFKLSIFILLVVPKITTAQNDNSTRSIKYFQSADFRIGLNVNQGKMGMRFFATNYSPSFHVNFDLVVINRFSITAGLNSFQKVFYGNYTHSTLLKDVTNGSKSVGIAPGSDEPPKIIYSSNYFSTDLKLKIALLSATKKNNIFVYGGGRMNFLTKSRYENPTTDQMMDLYVIPNLKKSFLNFVCGIEGAITISKKSKIVAAIEINNDTKKFITDWKSGGAVGMNKSEQKYYAARFQHIFLQLGYRIYLPN